MKRGFGGWLCWIWQLQPYVCVIVLLQYNCRLNPTSSFVLSAVIITTGDYLLAEYKKLA